MQDFDNNYSKIYKLINKGYYNLDEGLKGAAQSGNIDLITYFIKKIGNNGEIPDWKYSLQGAAEGGNMKIVEFFIKGIKLHAKNI